MLKSFIEPVKLGQNNMIPLNSAEDFIVVEDGDILIVGSDGFFDNINDDEIIKIIQPFWNNNNIETQLEIIAEFLGEHSEHNSQQPFQQTPISQRAKQEYQTYLGGRLDDITLCISIIKKQST